MTEVRAVMRVFDILEILRTEKEPQSLASLHQRLGLSKTTLSRLLGTLEVGGYVEKDRGLQVYSLGMKFLHYGFAVSDRLAVKQVAPHVLRRIRDACLETVYIYILHNSRRICVDCLQGKNTVRVMAYVGQEAPLYAGSAGKIMLAYFTTEELDKYFRENDLIPLTDITLAHRQLLEEDLRLARQRGYSVSLGEKIAGVMSVSAPIWDERGRVTASLSIAAPVERQPQTEAYIKLVTEGAAEISSHPYRG